MIASWLIVILMKTNEAQFGIVFRRIDATYLDYLIDKRVNVHVLCIEKAVRFILVALLYWLGA